MANFRTASLFHYTTMNSLKRLIKEGIKPNFCKEDFSADNSKFVLGIPMVSFCDIPLTRTYEFTSRYGKHAIGLSKEWALRNKINPILYISNNDIVNSLKFHKSYELHLKKELEKIGSDGLNLRIALDKPDSVSNLTTLVNHANSHSANLKLLGFAKKYLGVNPKTKAEQCNYEENEWRYIIEENKTNGINWMWSNDEYNQWRGTGNKPAPSSALEEYKLTFEINDISHIIVEFERQIPELIKYIEKLNQIGGSDKKISDDERMILLSKIISMEKIKNDF